MIYLVRFVLVWVGFDRFLRAWNSDSDISVDLILFRVIELWKISSVTFFLTPGENFKTILLCNMFHCTLKRIEQVFGNNTLISRVRIF